jgi:hypothetical protein
LVLSLKSSLSLFNPIRLVSFLHNVSPFIWHIFATKIFHRWLLFYRCMWSPSWTWTWPSPWCRRPWRAHASLGPCCTSGPPLLHMSDIPKILCTLPQYSGMLLDPSSTFHKWSKPFRTFSDTPWTLPGYSETFQEPLEPLSFFIFIHTHILNVTKP